MHVGRAVKYMYLQDFEKKRYGHKTNDMDIVIEIDHI